MNRFHTSARMGTLCIALLGAGCVEETSAPASRLSTSQAGGAAAASQAGPSMAQFAGDYGLTVCTKDYFQSPHCGRPALTIRADGGTFQILTDSNGWVKWPVSITQQRGSRFAFTYVDNKNGGDGTTKRGYVEFFTVSGVKGAKLVLSEVGDQGDSFVDMAQVRGRTNLPLKPFRWTLTPDLHAQAGSATPATSSRGAAPGGGGQSGAQACIKRQDIDYDPTEPNADRAEYYNMCGRVLTCTRRDNGQSVSVGQTMQIATWIIDKASCR